MSTKPNIAMIGTGLMGRPMAERILKAGYRLTAWNRTPEKAAPLAELGATISKNAAEAISGADGVVLMLSDHPAIEHVLFASEPPAVLSGKTVIQMGTISPEQSTGLHRRIEAGGGDYFEAPVLGSLPEARKGELIVMAGASDEQLQRWSGLLACFGPAPLLIGDVGRAAVLKLAMNQLIASLTAAFCLSLALVRKSGVSTDRFMEILRKSALYAPTFDKKLDRMLAADFSDPNFPTRHLAKDVGLALSAAAASNLDTAGLDGVRRIVEEALHRGLGDADYSAIYSVICPQR
ncbi:MAG: NAD(P)-dependent oxidoreductase [Desulfobacterales bacterium]|nr:NAD(P)-dependent oxidoreductase [Desulfobacterales bacterium]